MGTPLSTPHIAGIDTCSVQFSRSVEFWLFATPWTAARQASLSIATSRSLLKLMSIESVMPSNHLILCHSLLLLPSTFPSIKAFSNESVLHIRWPKYWSFSFSMSSSNEYSGLISFRMDWLGLLTVQGILKSLLQDLLRCWQRTNGEPVPLSSPNRNKMGPSIFRSSLVAQVVKNPPVMQEIPVRFLGQEDPLEKG